MCYSLQYVKNNQFFSYMSNSWSEVLNKYEKLFNTDVSDLLIRDNEYGVEFKNWAWDRSDNLLGWAGGNA